MKGASLAPFPFLVASIQALFRLKTNMENVSSYKQENYRNGVGGSIRIGSSLMNPAIGASAMMAVAGMGDALLYAYLPIEATALGLSVFMVGVLLSVNKFVRFFTNRLVAYLADRWGIKNILLIGIILAALSTFVYALNPVVWIWVASRVVWGVAYSSLRFSSIQYAGTTNKIGSVLGLSRSIQEIGPIIAYWIGPLVITIFNAKLAFSAIGFATIALLPLFYFLPDYKVAGQAIQPFKFDLPGLTDLWVFISSFATEGLIVVGISKILNINFSDTNQLLIISALYISSRRFLNIVISPVSGWLSDRWHFNNLFNISCLLIILGLLFIALEQANIGVFIAFLGAAVNTTLIPIIAIKFTQTRKRFDVLTRLSTSRDIGSALGALLGLLLLSAVDKDLLFLVLSVVLVSVWFYLRKLENQYE